MNICDIAALSLAGTHLPANENTAPLSLVDWVTNQRQGASIQDWILKLFCNY